MGVPNEYVIEFFAPTLDHYEVIHNVELEAGEDEPSRGSAGPATEQPARPTRQEALQGAPAATRTK